MTDVEQSPDSPEPKKSLWKKWMEWNGSFLVLSIVFHVLLLAVAAWLVVGIVGKRKEKMKFTAPPPAPAAQEHHVKPAKKTTSSAPPVMKRIASTAINPQIALPEVSMNSPSTDVMSKVMSGMGQSGLGAGASGGGGGLPSLSGLTAFGFKGSGGLKGTLYDLKQTQSKTPTAINAKNLNGAFSVMEDFFTDWDAKRVFESKNYFKAPNSLSSTQWFIPDMDANKAPEAFDVAGIVKPTLWFVHYKGKVRPPFSGRFRFVGRADNLIAVRFNGKNVFVEACGNQRFTKLFPGTSIYPGAPVTNKSEWIDVLAGHPYEMEVALSEWGGLFEAVLFVEEEHPKNPYPQGTLPVFQARRDMDIIPYGNDRWKKPVPAPKNTLIFGASAN